ncbi:MAG TPA: hypothetical protein VKF15_07810 [Nitrososphaerales archaeon]|nr:hypothetical protein [Nitrososphaerales archaeon]
MKCRLCSRDAAGDLCPYHMRAKENVEAAYEAWVRAYGGMDWKTYLDRVITNGETGQRAKEVAELLVGRLNDKNNP